MLPTSSALRSNVSAAMGGPPVGDRITPGSVSDGRPRVALPCPFRGKAPDLREPPRPRQQRCAFRLFEQLRQRRRQARLHEAPEVVAQTVWKRLAGEVPDDGAQLGVGVEAETVVDRPDATVGTEQAVAALAIRVVRDEIEGADTREPVAVGGILAQREVVLAEVRLHKLLQRALAVGARPTHGERHQSPAERLRKVIGGELALEQAGGKIPERALAALRLVDGKRGGTVESDLHQERRVRAARQPSLQRHLALREERRDVSGRRDRCSWGTRARPDPWAGCTSDRSAAPPSRAPPRAPRTPSPARV